jgi:hypothetical protein
MQLKGLVISARIRERGGQEGGKAVYGKKVNEGEWTDIHRPGKCLVKVSGSGSSIIG